MKTLYLGTALVVLAWCSGALGAPSFETSGFSCDLNNNPCQGPDSPGTCNFHFEHEEPDMFVQCREMGTKCFEMSCPINQFWIHEKCTCAIEHANPCVPNPCENGGTCESSGNGFTCTCKPGWMGETCDTPDHCFSDPCENGGSCENGDDGFTCTCEPGWMGETCETPDFCNGDPCKNGGTCTNGDNGFTCTCAPGWIGETCKIPDYCFGDPCKNGGSCKNEDDGFTCTCIPPWIGDTCEDKPSGHDCSLENNPCTGPDNPGTCNFHFQHFDSSKFVQCNEFGTQCFEMPCSPGTHWLHHKCTCA